MSAIAKVETLPPANGSQPIPLAQSESAALIHMIDRAARDVTLPLDRLEKLIQMRIDMEDRERARAFDLAMAGAQSEMRPVAADSLNPQTKSRYASYAALDRVLRPIYTKHGLVLSFNTESGAPENCVRVACYVSREGHSKSYSIDMPADGKGAKGGDVMTRTHATGAAVTYGRRYLLLMIFNIAVGDDDGNGATGTSTITAEQAEQITQLISETKSDITKFLKVAGAESISDIPAAKFSMLMTMLNAKKAKQ